MNRGKAPNVGRATDARRAARLVPEPDGASPGRPMQPAALHPLARLPEEWRAHFEARGERGYRAQQVFRWLHGRGVFDPERMTNLAKPLRSQLASEGSFEPGHVAHVHESRDGTRKLVLEFARGAKVEAVLIPMTAMPDAEQGDADLTAVESDEDDLADAQADPQRVTLCISTQFGCAMGCVFCASGQAGLVRGLSADEIVYQVLAAQRYLKPEEALKNLVFMGMGEPLHHYEATARALRLLTHPDGAAISPRRITVSTVGLVPGIRRLGQDFGGKIGLAVSLHAPNGSVRDRIIPMNRRYAFDELLAALRAYPLPQRRRITIEYTLIDGVNDQVVHAEELARALHGLRVKINLIPMNAIDASDLRAPSASTVRAFRDQLTSMGYSCFVRTRRGDDVAAACGQLAMNQTAGAAKGLSGQRDATGLVPLGALRDSHIEEV